jgi:hypothetical protein
MSVLELFEVEVRAVATPFLVYRHTLSNDPHSKFLHRWEQIGHCAELEDAQTIVDGEESHTVVLHKGVEIYTNNRPVKGEGHGT